MIRRTAFYLRLTMLPLLCGGLPIESGAATSSRADDLAVANLRVEYRRGPMGIDAGSPRFSWILESGKRATRQTAYWIQVAESAEAFRQNQILWETGRVESGQSIHVEYRGPDLISTTRYHWRVQVWDNHGRKSDWSEVAFWEMGLLDPQDWQAKWIEPDLEEDVSTSPPAPMLRREFHLNGKIRSARAYVTAHGVYEMELNGKRVGDQVLSPGWTSYHERLQYQTYDITDLLKSGENAVGVYLGDGWFRGYMGFKDQRNLYGEKLALLAQIHITYEDGSSEVIATDENWKAATGPIVKSDIYNGETYDARLEMEAWSDPSFDDSDWVGVRIIDHGRKKLIAQQAPPVRKIQALRPREILKTPEGDTVVDMGQNMVGWVRLRVEGEEGAEVTLRHAEVLDRDGNFYTANIRAADQTNVYILKGAGEEVWEPRFTFQGFRYVAVDGYPGELTLDDLTGIVLHSDIAPTGHFQCSHELVNQLQHNIVWGQKGNFLDIPTDCPQRDERLGWTGDIQVFVETANLNLHTPAFLSKWLGDVEADQLENGSIPHVVPNVLGEERSGSAGWADAGVIVPWALYWSFGDIRILERQYASMKAWVDFEKDRAASNETTYLRDGDFTYGDWLSFNTTRSAYPGAYTDKDFISTAFFAHSADLLSRTARLLGKEEEADSYSELFGKIKEAFQQEYVTPNGRVMSNTQTAYLLALRFDLLPEDLKPAAIEHLVGDIRGHGHLTTGFLGTPHLNPVLSQHGRADLAYDLLLREEYPSWLYPVTRGATTIWERWDGIKRNGTFQNPGMNSFNHYAYGAIGEWLFKEVAGIQAEEPGYGRMRIGPVPGGGLDHARALLDSPYGRIESAWEIAAEGFSLEVEIPANTTATVVLPDARVDSVTEGGNGLADAEGVQLFGQEESNVTIQLGSGRYRFSYPMDAPDSETNGGVSATDAEETLGRDDKMGRLLADRKAREVLHRHIGALMDSPWLSQVMGFSLDVAARSLPEEHRLDKADVDAIYRELEELKP